MLNKVMLIGRLGRDPELKQTQSGKSVCIFTLATDNGYGDNKKTDWHNIVVFDKIADSCAKYLRKGTQVYVEGRITYDSYEKDGIKRTSVKIIANSVHFLGAKADNMITCQQKTDHDLLTMSNDTFEGYPINDEVPF